MKTRSWLSNFFFFDEEQVIYNLLVLYLTVKVLSIYIDSIQLEID